MESGDKATRARNTSGSVRAAAIERSSDCSMGITKQSSTDQGAQMVELKLNAQYDDTMTNYCKVIVSNGLAAMPV